MPANAILERMFPSGRPAAGTAAPLDLTELIHAVNSLAADGSDAVLIDQIGLLERLKSCCAAVQAVLTHALVASQTADGAARQVRPELTRRSVAAQVGLARRDSRHRGGRLVGFAGALVTEMPCTLAALRTGVTSERRSMLILDQFACLTQADRRRADALIAADLPTLGDLAASTRAAAIACRLDVEAVLGKVRGAVSDRHVTIRPAPDTMTRLSALLPVAQGVAVYAALRSAADTAVGTGDGRSRGQLMADDLVSRVTGQSVSGCDPYGVPRYGPATPAGPTEARAAAPANSPTDAPAELPAAVGASAGPGPAVALNLIMTDRTLLGGDGEPAHLTGYGPIPAPLARALVLGHADTATRTFVRRLYTNPTTGQLIAMDSRQRLFPAGAQQFLIARDQACRTPWCDAPIRHIDHIEPHARGGPTTIDNGQGLCTACNLTKQAPGWRNTIDTPASNNDGTINLTTPTGHTYPSHPPRPPTSPPWPDISPVETHFSRILLELVG